MSEHITIERAAAIMGVSQQTVRIGLQKGIFPFGAAVQLPGSSRFTYIIYPAEFERLYGTNREESK